MEQVAAKWFHTGRLKPIRLIVVHCTVSSEMGTGAEAVANYFAAGTRRASAHRVCDNNSTVICVADEDTAFGAAGANSDGLHLELVGQPTQSAAEWLDPYSQAELFQAGLTIREWSAKHDVPLRWLTVDEVADGTSRGLCTHADVSKAFPEVSTGHWDPGPNFPKAEALRIWTPNTPPQEDDMTPEENAALGRIDQRTAEDAVRGEQIRADLAALAKRVANLETGSVDVGALADAVVARIGDKLGSS